MDSTQYARHPFEGFLSLCELFYRVGSRFDSEDSFRNFFDDIDSVWGDLGRKRINLPWVLTELLDIKEWLKLGDLESDQAQTMIDSLHTFAFNEDRDELPPGYSSSKRRQTFVSLHYLNVHMRTESFQALGVERLRGHCRAMSELIQYMQAHGWVGEAFEAELEKLVVRLDCISARINYHRPFLPWD
jgi:hypothetical protein